MVQPATLAKACERMLDPATMNRIHAATLIATCLAACVALAAGSRQGSPSASAADRPIYRAPSGKMDAQVLLDEAVTGRKDAAVTLLTSYPGATVPEHVHAGVTEVLYILEGHGRMTLAGVELEVAPGMAISIPPDTKHSFRHVGKGIMRAVQVYVGAGPEQRFKKWTALE